jgi:hypothetical protein
VDAPFTPDGLGEVLALGARDERDGRAHFDLAHWCYRFHTHARPLAPDLVLDPLTEAAVGIAEEVDARWERFVVSAHPTEALLTLDLAAVRLPLEWFQGWLLELEAARAQAAKEV